MADTWNITASLDKNSYTKGDPMTLSVSGTVTGAPTTSSGSVQAHLTASDTTGFIAPSCPYSVTNPAPALTFVLSLLTDSQPRTWTIAADGMSATATA